MEFESTFPAAQGPFATEVMKALFAKDAGAGNDSLGGGANAILSWDAVFCLMTWRNT